MQKKLIAVALGAFGYGAALGWAITADINERKLKEEREGYDWLLKEKTEHIWALQQRIEHDWATRNEFTTVVDEVDPNQTELMDIYVHESNEPIKTVVEVTPDVDVSPVEETVEETRSNLQKIIDTYTSTEDSKTFVDMMEHAYEDDNSPPFVISRSDYAWDEEGENYTKITLTYYPRDRVLLDDEEDPVEDVARTIGWRNLNHFGGISEDPEVVFIRNRKMTTDFEVIKEEGQLPLHVKYGMDKEEFRANRAAGVIKLRQEDDDY